MAIRGEGECVLLCPSNNRDVGSERKTVPRSPCSAAADAKPRAGLAAAASLSAGPCRAPTSRPLPSWRPGKERTAGLPTAPGHRPSSVCEGPAASGGPCLLRSTVAGACPQGKCREMAGRPEPMPPRPGCGAGRHAAQGGTGSAACGLGAPGVWGRTTLPHTTKHRPRKTSTPC